LINILIIWGPFLGLCFWVKKPFHFVLPPILWSFLFLLTYLGNQMLAETIKTIPESRLFALANTLFLVMVAIQILLLKLFFQRSWNDIILGNLVQTYTWIQVWWLLAMSFQNKLR